MFGKGFRACLPVAASVAAYGSVLGVLAAQKQLSWGQVLWMDLLVFAGSAQFVMVDLWAWPPAAGPMALAVGVINARYLLIGATLRPVFEGRGLLSKLFFMHFVADENWAVTMAAHRQGGADVWHLWGGGLCVMGAWCLGTLVGVGLGAAVPDPEAWALDFAFTAVFTALAVSLWRGARRDGVPWAAAVGAACLAERWLPGTWYVLAGGLAGAVAAAFGPEGEA
ncbi:MAG: branched-chain amino acid ABC transporter permease [Candidatus Dadabacteria bacterium]|nr:MAG: branched-chain amino acid ABC transporter permease [Candidatus Dadabacteria bacterium]